MTVALLYVAGLVALVLGAESLVRGSSRLALGLGISPLVVGLTIVAFGTSAPELAVSVGAVVSGRTDIAIGNVIGSNVLNVLLILGVSALIVPLVVHAQIIRQEVPVMIGASVILVAMVMDGTLGRIDALVLVLLMLGYTVFLVRQSRAASASTRDEYAGELRHSSRWDRHRGVQLLLVLVGMALLVVGARWLVEAAVEVARGLGISDVVIGLTVVAVGTSMPEIATSLIAALRGERDIAVGNVVGSNTFNILACLGAAGLFAADGLVLAPSVLNFDLWVMVAVAVACLPVFVTGNEIARWEGALFVAYLVAYMLYLVLNAQHHDALPAFSAVMLSFVIPLTVVTLVIVLVRTLAQGAGR
ncbi:MAG: calcium/sodium antiporter [Burkholderiales bacterium]|nr:MAG: calcium/sodium antiporter [Burkholderiales bacterium]